MNATQRFALISVTGAYCTAPTEVLPIIAGVLPIRLEAERRTYAYKVRKNIGFNLNEFEYTPRLAEEDSDRWTRLIEASANRNVRKEIIMEWQMNWRESERITRRFFPDCKKRMRMTWVRPNHYTCQFLSGHGKFAQKLAKLGLCDDENCECGEPEDSEHVLMECELWEDLRVDLKIAIDGIGHGWPVPLDVLMRREIYNIFEKLAYDIIKAKEEREMED